MGERHEGEQADYDMDTADAMFTHGGLFLFCFHVSFIHRKIVKRVVLQKAA